MGPGTPGRRAKPLIERVMARITIDPESGCWLWQGASSGGYGNLSSGSRRDGTRGRKMVHRVSYEHHRGPIPEGLVLDHLCRTTLCVNPAHLEPVPQGVNVFRGEAPSADNRRKTHCAHGHEFNEANTYLARGRRYCRACRRNDNRRREKLKRQSQQSA